MSRQQHFLRWALDIFGPIAGDPKERLARFIEEAIELAQADDMPRDMLAKIVDRVYARDRGFVPQEIGQAYATLELYAESIGLDADRSGEGMGPRKDHSPRRVGAAPCCQGRRRHSRLTAAL